MPDDQEIRQTEVNLWWSFREKCIEHSKDYGAATIRSLILINGGAIIALLTFISSARENNRYFVDVFYLKCSIALFLAAIILAVIAGALGYFNFQSNALMVPRPDRLQHYVSTGEPLGISDKSKAIRRTALSAALFVGLAVFCFVAACVSALQGISAL